MDGYRLRSSHGDTIDPRQPLPVLPAVSNGSSRVSAIITYNGKAAAGAITVNSLQVKPIYTNEGDQVASFWGDVQNLVYEAFADGNPKKRTEWLTSVTETNGSAAFAVFDPNRNLEEMFESVTGTVKRFIAKLKDKTGHVLYGWIRGVSVSSNLYTFEVFNARLTETQNWVGTLASFDNANLESVEIYRYNSSLSFGTGTTLTEEVDCPKEFSKSWELVMKYAETLANGQYFVDYMRGRVIGVKADTTVSEVVTYQTVGNDFAQPSTSAAITVSDSTDLLNIASKGIFVSVPSGVTTTVAYKLVGDSSASSVVLTASQYLPGKFSRVMSTGTTLNGATIVGYGG